MRSRNQKILLESFQKHHSTKIFGPDSINKNTAVCAYTYFHNLCFVAYLPPSFKHDASVKFRKRTKINDGDEVKHYINLLYIVGKDLTHFNTSTNKILSARLHNYNNV